MEIGQRETAEKSRNIGLVWTSVLELMALAFLVILECILRTSDAFPVRSVPFSRTDDVIRYSKEEGSETMKSFVYNADVQYSMIVVLSFCVPPLLILICELIKWKLADNHIVHVATLCIACELHTVLRRLIRFTGTFLTGMLTTMVFIDVIKFMVGRPRPIFLDVCQVNGTLCPADTALNAVAGCTEDMCTQPDKMLLRWARLSFPSFHAAVTSYSACFMAIYVQTMVCVHLRCHVLGPCLSLTGFMAALLCALARYSLYYSHWTDVVIGFALGTVIAFYVSVFVLDEFEERRDVTRSRLVRNLDHVWIGDPLSEQHNRSNVPWYWATWQWNLKENMDRESVINQHRSYAKMTDDVISLGSVGMTSRDRHVAESTYAYY